MRRPPDVLEQLYDAVAKSAKAHSDISLVDQAMADVRRRQRWVRGEMRIEHSEMDEAAPTHSTSNAMSRQPNHAACYAPRR